MSNLLVAVANPSTTGGAFTGYGMFSFIDVISGGKITVEKQEIPASASNTKIFYRK